jgi:hypothetical protein
MTVGALEASAGSSAPQPLSEKERLACDNIMEILDRLPAA